MKQLFQNLGLTEKEMNIFLLLLELGAQPVSVVAKHAGIPRSTMYLVVDKLKKLQLIEVFERKGMKYVKCISVKAIADVLKTRERKIKQTEEMFRDALPELEMLESKLSITPVVKFYEGREAVMGIYEEVLREKEFCAFFYPAYVKKTFPEYHYKIGEALKKTGGKARELLITCPEAEEYQKKFHSKKHQIRILPENTFFSSDTIICDQHFYMTTYSENQVSGTKVINSALARTQREVFDLVWGN